MRKIDMSKEPCSECGGRLERKHIDQAGANISKPSGIAALVCSDCGEICFSLAEPISVAAAANLLLALLL